MAKVKVLVGRQSLRLSAGDRQLLADLSRLGIVTERSAVAHCYDIKQSSVSRRLKNLADAGLLSQRDVVTRSGEKIRAYEFGSDRVAKAFGGRKIAIDSSRRGLHECIVSELYYDLGRPDDFRVESRFTRADMSKLGDKAVKPDAIYSEGDSVVLVEADSGQYTKPQIDYKISAWRGFNQVWGQPQKSVHSIEGHDGIRVFKY